MAATPLAIPTLPKESASSECRVKHRGHAHLPKSKRHPFTNAPVPPAALAFGTRTVPKRHAPSILDT
jgi:hypothetical protein